MIYLDYNATTPVDKEVAEVMIPYLYGHFGNPSSSHSLGQEAKVGIERARTQVANFLNCTPGEVLLQAGAASRIIPSSRASPKHIDIKAITLLCLLWSILR